tara:strand:+ start:135 stop:293 length:159 start_codon:yes stop_codon:yes gene_type:complete
MLGLGMRFLGGMADKIKILASAFDQYRTDSGSETFRCLSTGLGQDNYKVTST